MSPFDYQRPRRLEEALAALRADPDARPLAGGQSLLPTMRQGLASPTRLVDLGAIPTLRGIDWSAPEVADRLGRRTLRIGAMCTHTEIARSALVRTHLPMLAELAEGIGDRQVRNRGTVGGSLANHDPAACHPAGALALGAGFETDRRWIPADDFFTGLFGTALAADELLVAIHYPIPEAAAYRKFDQPASRFALVGVAVARFAGEVRCAITGAAAGVFRATAFERALGDRFEPAALAGHGLDPNHLMTDLHAGAAYRAHLAAVLTARAVAAAAHPTPPNRSA